jgi:hypothetical protein
VRTYYDEIKIEVFFLKNKIVIDKKEENIKKCIHASTCGITKSGLIEKPPKKGICKIKYGFNIVFQ